MTDRTLLRLSATLLFVGIVLSVLVGALHPAHENPNNHPAVFAEYAASANWTAVHLGQFVGWVVIIAGLLVLYFALNVHAAIAGWMARFAAISAVGTLALTGVLQAVDGVALKQAVDAWVSAPAAEKAAYFASAEGVRWLEWGIRSYQSFLFGLVLVLFAGAIVGTTRSPRLIGYLMGLSGLTYLVQGWILGSEGFSPTNTIPQLLAYLLVFVWSIWLLILAWRMKESAEVALG
jgi:hypothetical protein